MGVVYEAHQDSLNRRVALKILPFAAVLDQRQIARFRNEAQAAAQLHHPHIVPVFAVGQEHGVYYYAMQYIDGKSLEAAIDELRTVERRHADARHDPRPRRDARLDEHDRAPPRLGALLRSVDSQRRVLPQRRPARQGSGRGAAARPRLRHRPPRREAVEPAARSAGQALGHRLRPGADPKRQRRHAHRRRRRHAPLHEPRAGVRPGGHGRRPHRRLLARRHALRAA